MRIVTSLLVLSLLVAANPAHAGRGNTEATSGLNTQSWMRSAHAESNINNEKADSERTSDFPQGRNGTGMATSSEPEVSPEVMPMAKSSFQPICVGLDCSCGVAKK